jgi:hypothetical protein
MGNCQLKPVLSDSPGSGAVDAPRLTARDLEILQSLLDPQFANQKDMARSLGITLGTLKVHMWRIHLKLRWPGGPQRMLILWAVAHREQFGLRMPKAAMEPRERTAGA